jgi:hypothetical protein
MHHMHPCIHTQAVGLDPTVMLMFYRVCLEIFGGVTLLATVVLLPTFKFMGNAVRIFRKR